MADDESYIPMCYGCNLSNIVACPQFTDLEVAAYLAWKAGQADYSADKDCRSLVYVASSVGRLNLLRNFLQKRPCLNEQDVKNNSSPLHFAVSHGQIHCIVRLMQLGANASLLDKDHLVPIDISLIDIRTATGKDKLNVHSLCEPYVWGTNANYTLGIGHNRERLHPEPQDFFRKRGLHVKQVGMQKFHTVFICTDGSAWSCGHGTGGRLGLTVENAALEPKRIPLSAKMSCIAVSVADDHSMLLTDIGLAWTCGLNTHKQLGISPPPAFLLTPKPVRSLSKLIGICAAPFHSVFWSKTQIFTCGLNGGQLGHSASDGASFVIPKEIAYIKLKGDSIVDVSSSPAALAVLDNEGAVFLIHGYKCSRVTPRGWLRKSRKVLVQGGSLDPKTCGPNGDYGEIKIALLTDDIIYLFRGKSATFLPCIFNVRRELRISDVAFINTGFIMSTALGEAFLGYFRSRHKAEEAEFLDLVQLAHIHRATAVSADPRGRNFSVLQASPRIFVDFQPPSSDIPTLRDELLSLLAEASEDDPIHDIIFLVEGQRFPAHRYLVLYANENTAMKKLFDESKENEIPYEVHLPNIPVAAFKHLLTYVYSMTCDFIANNSSDDSDLGEDAEKISAFESYNKGKDRQEVKDLRFVARRLGVTGLMKQLDGKKAGKKELNRKAWKFDVTLKSSDGTLINVHKCILVARLDYFRVMLTHGWRESKEMELSVPVSGRILEALVEFLYTDHCRDISECTDLDFLSLVLVATDELFCEGLKRLTEESLVNVVTLRNAVDLLQLATTYNAPYLLSYTQLFICQNLSAFLETRSLEILSDTSLQDLTSVYRQNIPQHRKLRCSLDPLEIATVKSVAESFPVTLDFEGELAKPSVKTPTPKKKERRDRKTSERIRLTSVSSVEENIVATTPPVPRPEAFSRIETLQANTEPCEPSKVSQIVQARLKAIGASLRSSDPTIELTPLVEKLEVSLEKDFPELNNSRQEKNRASAVPKTSPSDSSKKFTKISQKERRRLASLPPSEEEPDLTPPRSAWAIIPPAPFLVDAQSPPRPTNLAAIIVSEKVERERNARLRSKPLHLTQLEESAIHDLAVFYNAANATEERITVRRLHSSLPSPPVWVNAIPRQTS